MSKKFLAVVTFLSVVMVTDLIRRHVLTSTTKRDLNIRDYGSLGDFIPEQLEKRNNSKSAGRSPGAEGVENVLKINKNSGITDHNTEGKDRIFLKNLSRS